MQRQKSNCALGGDNLEKQTYTVEEAAQILGIGRTSAYEAVHTGELIAIHMGRRFLVPKTVLERLLGGPLPEQPAVEKDRLN